MKIKSCCFFFFFFICFLTVLKKYILGNFPLRNLKNTVCGGLGFFYYFFFFLIWVTGLKQKQNFQAKIKKTIFFFSLSRVEVCLKRAYANSQWRCVLAIKIVITRMQLLSQEIIELQLWSTLRGLHADGVSWGTQFARPWRTAVVVAAVNEVTRNDFYVVKRNVPRREMWIILA